VPQIKVAEPGKTTRIKSIDGVRGVAVLLVIFYHAKISQLPMAGGFVGVDIFYVVSGYVVCKSLQEGLDNKTFLFEGFTRGV